MSFKKQFLTLFLAILALGTTAQAKLEFDVRFDKEAVAGAHDSVMLKVFLKGDKAENVNAVKSQVTLPEGFSSATESFVQGPLYNAEVGGASNKATYMAAKRLFVITMGVPIENKGIPQFTAPADWTLFCEFPVNFDKGLDQPVSSTNPITMKITQVSIVNDRGNQQTYKDFTYPETTNLAINDNFELVSNPTELTALAEDFATFSFSASSMELAGKAWDDQAKKLVDITQADMVVKTLVEKPLDGAPALLTITDNKNGTFGISAKENVFGTTYLEVGVASKAYPENIKTFTVKQDIDSVDDPTVVTLQKIVTAEPKEGAPLEVGVWIKDIDTVLDPESFSYQVVIAGTPMEASATVMDNFGGANGFTATLKTNALPFDVVAHPDKEKEVVVQVIATATAESKSGEMTAVIADVDQAPEEINAPDVTIPAGPYMTDTKIVIDDFIVDGNFSDADGDEIKPHYYWTKAGEEVAGATIPTTAKKGETWTPRIRVYTMPYGEEVTFKTYDGDPITIVDSPAVKVSSVDSLFIQKSEAITGSWTITFSDADIADGTETYSKEAIPVPVAKNGDVTVDKVTFNSDYTYTVTYTYKVGDPSKEFTEPDTFEIAINSEGGKGFTVPFSVNYMEDPAPVIAVTTEPVLTIAEGDDAVITAEISAADSNTAVAPTGVQSIVWTMTLNEGTSNGALIALDAKAEGFVATEGVTPASSKVTVKVPFNVLSGRDRSATATYTLTATAKDKNAASSKSWVITVHDTDQAPVITEAILTNSVDADAIFTGTDVTVTASGATDPDGDAIAYYTFNGDKADESHSIKATNLVKGDVLDFEVVAYSKPAYSSTEGVLNSETKAFAKQITVLNSAPTANAEAKTVETSEVADDTTEVVFELANMAEFKDIDMITVGDKLRDSLTYSIGAPNVAAAGTLAVDAATGAVTYKPAKFYNGSFSFELTATDESADTAKATVNVTVKPVNDAPFIVGRDIYHVPSDCDGTTQTATFTVNMGGGEDEKAQTIAEAKIIEVLNGLDLDLTTETAVTIVNDGETRTISFQYTLTPDTAEKLGKETVVKLQVKDATTDGTEAKESAVFEMKIVLGASPWYPTVEAKDFTPADALVADGSKAYMVEIVDATGAVAETIKIAGNDIMAADYLDYTDGLLPGEYSYNVYEWNPSTGKGTDAVASAKVVVDDYTAAAKPTLVATETAANVYELKISAPMASMYRLDITTPAGETISSWGRFMADAEGIIRSEVTLNKNFYDAGTYTLTVSGWNPKMEAGKPGEASDAVTIEIQSASTDVTEFPAISDGGYRPADNKAILVAKQGKAVVDFAWPNISTNATYTLYVYTATGKLVNDSAIACGSDSVASVALDVTDAVTPYMWRISAKVSGKTIWSDSLSFKLVTSSEAPLVQGVYAGRDANTLEVRYEAFSQIEGITYDVMAYDVAGKQWTKLVQDVRFEVTSTGEGKLVLPAGALNGIEAGDYVYLRAKVNGKAISISFEDFLLKSF